MWATSSSRCPRSLVRRQVEGGEVLDRGAQTAHGRGRVQAVADHVPDDERDPGARQRDDVEPVAADPRLGGEVAVGDVEGALLGQRARQQAVLEGDGHRVLARVAAGVVDGHGGPGGQLLGQGQVLVLEGTSVTAAPEAGDAHQHAPCRQRNGDQRCQAELQHRLRALGVLHAPAGVGRQLGDQRGTPPDETRRLRGAPIPPDQLPLGVQRRIVPDARERHPPQLHRGIDHQGRGSSPSRTASARSTVA